MFHSKTFLVNFLCNSTKRRPAAFFSFKSNITPSISAKLDAKLHMQPAHPLCLVKRAIHRYFTSEQSSEFALFDQLSPRVTVKQNFDELLTPAEHVSRSMSDTYYFNSGEVLRCHMTAHQTELLRAGHSQFLMAGDVYRCDTVDKTHFPVFHQLDGVRLFDSGSVSKAEVERDLKAAVIGMVNVLFGECEHRWVEAYFPFTEPSWELEIWYQDEWLEVLGCGVMRDEIIAGAAPQRANTIGWAFGIGLERIAMALFGVPDIRLFWSTDERFTRQFRAAADDDDNNNNVPLRELRFTPYSKYPPVWHDLSFWIDERERFHENLFHALVREHAGDLIEQVELRDQFTHPKNNKLSHTYRLTFRHMDRSLTNDEIDQKMLKISAALGSLGVTLRLK